LQIENYELIKKFIENKGDSQIKKQELRGFEAFTHQEGDIVLNALTYSILMGNLPAIKYLVEDYKINLASSINICQLLNEEMPSQGGAHSEEELRIRLNPTLTLKLALDSFEL
jgi:hypothetical protein